MIVSVGKDKQARLSPRDVGGQAGGFVQDEEGGVGVEEVHEVVCHMHRLRIFGVLCKEKAPFQSFWLDFVIPQRAVVVGEWRSRSNNRARVAFINRIPAG